MKKESAFEHVCKTAAYHVSELMTLKAPGTMKCGIHNPLNPDKAVNVKIRIEKSSVGKIWDQVFLSLESDPPEFKGNWCGNRCGGRDVLMSLYSDVLKDIARSEIK